jgi:hypothetical protein
LLDKENAAHKPGEVMIGDITYLPLRAGKWSYLATWQDKFTEAHRGMGGGRPDD